MEEFKLTINLLPKGAWNNDFSKTLSKKDWDKLREFALKRAMVNAKFVALKQTTLMFTKNGSLILKRKHKL